MLDEFLPLAGAADLMPHGYCLFWRPELLGLHVLSDALIAVSYYSIPATLSYFAVKRADFNYRPIFLLFSAFILACGTTHFMEIWTLWNPDYWIAGMIKLVTAILSVVAVTMLWPLVPRILEIPSPAQLELKNQKLQQEIRERVRSERNFRLLNDNLEKVICIRTQELTDINARLMSEVQERKRIEQSLRESEVRYRVLFEQMPHTVVVMKAATGEFIDFNRTAYETLGYSAQDFRRLRISEIDEVDSDDDVRRRFEQIRSAGEVLFETRHVHRNGSVRDVLVNAKLIGFNNEEFVQAIWTDISDYKQLEMSLRSKQQELEISQRQIEHILKASPAVIYALDPTPDGGTPFRLRFVSESVAALTGFEASEWQSAPSLWFDRLHPDDRMATISQYQRLNARYSTGDAMICRYRLQRRDGNYRWIHDELRTIRDSSGSIVEIIGAWLDISALKETEEALLRSIRLKRAILDTANEGFLLLGQKSAIHDVNPAYCRMLGYRRQELIGRSLAEFELGTADEGVTARLARFPDSGADRFDSRQRKRNGEALEVEVSVSALPDRDDGSRYCCFVHDISERKRSEQRRLAEVETQRETLVNEVHHRIKNNLQGMIGLLGIHLQIHPEAAELINSLIGKIKSVAVVFGLQGRLGDNEIRLCEMTSEVCQGAELLAGGTLAPLVELQVAEPVSVDKSKAVAVALIINELVVNALKHGARSGSFEPISVTVRADPDAASVVIQNLSDGMPAGFDFERGSGLGTGLTLVRAMLPSQGAVLTMNFDSGRVTSRLRLTAPIVRNLPDPARC